MIKLVNYRKIDHQGLTNQLLLIQNVKIVGMINKKYNKNLHNNNKISLWKKQTISKYQKNNHNIKSEKHNQNNNIVMNP